MATQGPQGLSSQEARRRLKEFGPNEIAASRLASRWSEFKEIILDPMGLMLLGLAGLYFILCDRPDATVLLVAYVPVTAVDVTLEVKARKALRVLRATIKLTAKVLRDVKIHEILTKHIVAGDVLVFEEGQALPADGRLIEAEHLSVNEAALTGESVPVEKRPGDPFFGGTTVVQGRGLGSVEATAGKTRY